MDKTAIRNFAIEARKILMKSAITEAGFYGITKDGCKSPTQKGNDFEVYETVAGTENRIFGDDIKRRASLVKAIGDIGFDQVIEETAYTWFNRIIAIRFMEVNNYLPTRVRVLSSETGSGTPDIISQSDTVELNLSEEEVEKVQTAKKENRYDDAFRLLFIKQCNELNDILPGLFEKTDDYMELLLKITYTNDGVIRMLVDSIPESNFNVETEGQVEIIGWMYQYYNTELKDDTFAKLKKNIKVTKERIPAATQLFTPDWIVRYMVENSLGRVWIEHLRTVDSSVDEKTKAEEFGWKYYLPEAEQEEDVASRLVEIRKSYKDLAPQDITCIDPCMGSGHILVYMFDVLMDIYRSEGFSEREAVFDILEKNIRGLDIDRRAYQLSYFALMMKARGYNRIFFRGHEDIDGNRIQAVPRVYAIEESNSIEKNQLQYYGAGLDEMQKNNAINQMNGLLETLHDAKEYGSILNVENYDWKLLHSFVDAFDNSGQMSLVGFVAGRSQILLKKLVDIGEVLASKYDAVVTNPPYMGSDSMDEFLTKFIKKHYLMAKADLYAAFIIKCKNLLKKDGLQAMITQHSWMFLSSFDKMREFIVKECTISSMVHLGARAFEEISGEIVQTVSWVSSKYAYSFYGNYVRLVDYTSQYEKEKAFLAGKDLYKNSQDNFASIPGFPIAYWLSARFQDLFKNGVEIGKFIHSRDGLTTGKNELYIRCFWEVNIDSIGFGNENAEKFWETNKKYAPILKGGSYRKWYGNNLFVITYDRQGYQKLSTVGNKLPSKEVYFKEFISWNRISTRMAFRYCEKGYLFESASLVAYAEREEDLYYSLAFANTCLAAKEMQLINPTTNMLSGYVDSLKIPQMESRDMKKCSELAKECVDLAKKDWDSFEISWDYERNPLISIIDKNREIFGDKDIKLEDCFKLWEKECNDRFTKLKKNEEELNQIFINVYGLQDELPKMVDDKDVSVRKADKSRDVRSLISYAVGCMFGRYSLDDIGLIYAGGQFDSRRYKTFSEDKDAIIPITDEQYFEDDIVGRLEEFITQVYGKLFLEENLEYIADALGVKGISSRDRIRSYFINDFFKDHCSIYSVAGSGKRPIYWLFDSGKENGFKCLVYLHRYTPDMAGLIRSDYLTRTQNMIENALKNAEYAINTSSSAVDRAQATKKRDKYIKQLAEIRAYYPALSHIALQRINLDLDDGVKANYEKFQNIEVSIEGEKKQKVDLLAKI